MQKIFKIEIKQNYKLVYSLISTENQEIIQQEEVTPCILFNKNTIELFQESDNSIHFLQKWAENPENYNMYGIEFQKKSYELLPEVLFAIVINEIKKKVERDHIIEQTEIYLPSDNSKLMQRIKIALQGINLNGIELDNDEEITYDYSQQGEYLHDILEKKETVEGYQMMLKRALKIQPNAQKELESIDIDKENMFNEDEFTKEVAKKYNTKERSQMKLCKIDNYCLFIASRYLESLDDHINLVRVCKRMEKNMEKFHYNPTSLNKETVHFFPNVQTFHVYEEGDEYLEGGRIIAYCDWCKRGWYESEKIKEEFEGKNIEFKRIVWTRNDTKITFDEQNPNNSDDSDDSDYEEDESLDDDYEEDDV